MSEEWLRTSIEPIEERENESFSDSHRRALQTAFLTNGITAFTHEGHVHTVNPNEAKAIFTRGYIQGTIQILREELETFGDYMGGDRPNIERRLGDEIVFAKQAFPQEFAFTTV